jgi:hypothetical protein
MRLAQALLVGPYLLAIAGHALLPVGSGFPRGAVGILL